MDRYRRILRTTRLRIQAGSPQHASAGLILLVALVAPGCYGEEQYLLPPEDSAFEAIGDSTVFVMSNRAQVFVPEPDGMSSYIVRREDANAIKKPYTVLWLRGEDVEVRITDYRCAEGELRIGEAKHAGPSFVFDSELIFESLETLNGVDLVDPIRIK